MHVLHLYAECMHEEKNHGYLEDIQAEKYYTSEINTLLKTFICTEQSSIKYDIICYRKRSNSSPPFFECIYFAYV